MLNSSKKWFVIINPVSGNGKSKKSWKYISHLLKENDFDYTYSFTQFSGHATELTIKAVENGFRNIICVGGDGTLHHIVNGVLKQKIVSAKDVSIGVIPIGTGNDWIKTYSIPKKIKSAIKVIKRGNKQLQDIGELTLKSNKTTRYFINLAGVGFDGYVVKKVEKYKSFGAVAYLIGAIKAIASFKSFNAFVKLEHKEIKQNALMVLIGLCKYSGGGMQLTKNPNPLDGLFDISIAYDFKRFDIIKNILKLFNGNIVNFKKVSCFTAKELNIETYNANSALIEADGEFIGQGDFDIKILPKSFSFYC